MAPRRMANVLSDEKKQQVVALGRLGWPLRRIEDATGVRRETRNTFTIAIAPPHGAATRQAVERRAFGTTARALLTCPAGRSSGRPFESRGPPPRRECAGFREGELR